MNKVFIVFTVIFISVINTACSSPDNTNPEYTEMYQMFEAVVDDCSNLHKKVENIKQATYMYKNSFYNELKKNGVSTMDAQILTGLSENICQASMTCDDIIGDRGIECKEKLAQLIDVTIQNILGIPKENK